MKHSMPEKICRLMPKTPNTVAADGPGLPIEPHSIAHPRSAVAVGCPSHKTPVFDAVQTGPA